MSQAATFALALLLLGGGPVATDVTPDEPVNASVEVPPAEANTSGDTSTGETRTRGSVSWPSDNETSQPRARADANASSTHAGAQLAAGNGSQPGPVPSVELVVQVDGDELVNVTYTPPADVEGVPEPAQPAEAGPGEQGPPTQASTQQAAPADEGSSEVAWTLAPAAGLAALGAASYASPAGRWLRRLLALVPWAPLFSRIGPDEVLDHDSRAAIYELLQGEAGQTLEDLCEELDLARSTARHHVRKLEEAGMVDHARVGRSRVHYPVGERRRALRSHLLANDTRRAVHEAVRDRARSLTEIAEAIDANPGSVHFHVEKLEDAGLLEAVNGDGKRYRAPPGETRGRPPRARS